MWAFILSLIFLVLGVLNSKFLTPLNKLWHKFGILLGSIISPILMVTKIDIPAIENCFLRKEKQNTSLKIDYKIKYELD